MSRFRSFVVGFVLMLAAASAAWAGDIVGTAADATGAVLPAAQITLRNQVTGAELFAQADLEGRFRFPDVAPGRYLVTVESSGFAKDSKTGDGGRRGRARCASRSPWCPAASKWASR